MRNRKQRLSKKSDPSKYITSRAILSDGPGSAIGISVVNAEGKILVRNRRKPNKLNSHRRCDVWAAISALRKVPYRKTRGWGYTVAVVDKFIYQLLTNPHFRRFYLENNFEGLDNIDLLRLLVGEIKKRNALRIIRVSKDCRNPIHAHAIQVAGEVARSVAPPIPASAVPDNTTQSEGNPFQPGPTPIHPSRTAGRTNNPKVIIRRRGHSKLIKLSVDEDLRVDLSDASAVKGVRK
jgi:hypothetical protein